MDLLLRHLRPAALLADVDELRVRAARRRAPPPGSAGRRGSTSARAISSAARTVSSPGSPGPGADEVDRPGAHAIASARASRSAAPAASIRSASASASRRVVDEPLRAVGQADEAAQPERPAVHADRRVAGRAEARDHRALGVAAPRARRRRRPPRGASPARACSAQAALAGRGHEDVALERRAGTSSRPEPREPGGGEHERVGLAGGELAQARVDVAAQLDHVEVRAARRAAAPRRRSALVPTRAPLGQRRERRRRRRARRAGPRAAARRRSPCPSASSPGTSLALCTARSIAPVEQRLLQRAGPARLVARRRALQVARRRDLHDLDVARRSRSATQRAWASASALPRVPSRRLKSGAARAPPRGSCSAAAGASSSPNSSRSSERRAWRRSASSDFSALRRLVQQPLDGGAQHRLDALAVALAQRLPARLVLGQQLGDERVGLPAQRGDRRQHLERAEPAGERLDLLLDDALGAARLDPALAVRAGDLRLQAVDVDERDARQRGALGLDVARHREVEQQQRPPAARGGDERELLGADDRVRGGGGGDDDVGALQLAGQRVEGDRVAAEAAGRARSRARAGGWRRTWSRRPARSAPARSARPSRRRR